MFTLTDTITGKKEPFKSIRITLSEEATDILEKIMNDASFRSTSSTIEECIRAISDIISEMYLVLGQLEPGEESNLVINDEEFVQSFQRIVMRLNRFTGRTLRRVS